MTRDPMAACTRDFEHVSIGISPLRNFFTTARPRRIGVCVGRKSIAQGVHFLAVDEDIEPHQFGRTS